MRCDTRRSGSCCHIHLRVLAVVCVRVCDPLLLPGDPRRTLAHFSQENVSHYDIFLLEESREELYVGARDRVLALAVGTPGSIRAKASVSSHHFWGERGLGGSLHWVSVSPLGLGSTGWERLHSLCR